MSASTDSEMSNAGQLEDRARRLAGSHPASYRSGARPTLLDRLQEHGAFPQDTLREAYRHFSQESEGEGVLSGVSEWLLDNFYIVEQGLRQVRENMPAGYYRRLPKLDSTSLKGYPRAYAVAWEIIACCKAHLDMDRIVRFVHAYQQVRPLTTGELWALPTMLRLGILELLARTVAQASGATSTLDEVNTLATSFPDWVADLTNEEVVGTCIRSLRTLGTQDWKAFFEGVSRVETTLCEDPVDVYSRMDFDTRDRYRKVVEELARATGQGEEEIAQQAVELAEETHQQNHASPTNSGLNAPRAAHVGFYLVDQGRAQLEARLGYNPPWDVRLRRWLSDHPTLIYLSARVVKIGQTVTHD